MSAFIDWLTEQVDEGHAKTINQFKQPTREWWDMVLGLLRGQLEKMSLAPEPTWAPRWI